ncbi:MAG TPA: tetratricopeptide repeat protein [Candidatus Eremiobacteraceae bacterium]|nr:tetratricopeptide repeat protein [Candidatus Eremiobacteraceae bacterium]
MATVKDSQADSRGGPDQAAAQTAIASSRERLAANDPDGAAAALRHVATRSDATPAQLADAAKVMAEAGAPVEALHRFLEAGRGFYEAGDNPAARQNFAAAYEIDGKNMDALFELGRVDVAEGKKHDGLDKFVEVLRKSNLKHLPALYEAGCLYEQDGQHNQAILAFKRVVDREKSHVSALEHLGKLHQVRNQTGDAIAYFVRAAEAAHAQYRQADAKRLAEAALALDGGHAGARKVLADVEKSVSAGAEPKAESKPASETAAKPADQPSAAPVQAQAAPAPPAPAAPVVETSAVTPTVAMPAADGVPPPPPSTIDIQLPPDVALLEQRSQAMAQLAQVQNAVAQTYKQRLALEEEVRKAKAALDALQRQQQTVEDELTGKRDELTKIVAERDAEEASLAALGDAIAKSKNELASLSALSKLVEEVRAKCTSTADLAAKSANDVGAAIAQTESVRGQAAALATSVNEAQARLADARKTAEAAEKQLAEMANSAKAAQSAADGVAANATQAKTAMEALAGKRASVDAAAAELVALGEKVGQKRAEAEAAIKRLEALQAQRKSQFDEIIFKLPPLGAAPSVGPSQAPAPGVAPAAPPAQAHATAPAQATPSPAKSAAAPAGAPPSAVAPVDALIAAGKFAEAAQRAQTEANAKPKPADYLIEVGAKLRTAGKVDEAAKLFAAARDRDQKNGRARYELGTAFSEIGRDDDALAVLQTLENDQEYAVLGRVAAGKCLRRQGKVEAAESQFAKALEIEGRPEGQYHEALYQLADLHESKGDPESLGLALWSYEELQSGNPGYADVATRVAKLKAKLGESGTKSDAARNGAVKQ